jgi:hypothetical protein
MEQPQLFQGYGLVGAGSSKQQPRRVILAIFGIRPTLLVMFGRKCHPVLNAPRIGLEPGLAIKQWIPETTFGGEHCSTDFAQNSSSFGFGRNLWRPQKICSRGGAAQTFNFSQGIFRVRLERA